jgi:hypothetical protein
LSTGYTSTNIPNFPNNNKMKPGSLGFTTAIPKEPEANNAELSHNGDDIAILTSRYYEFDRNSFKTGHPFSIVVTK